MARKKEIEYVTDPELFRIRFSDWPDFTLMPKDFIFCHVLQYLYECGARELSPIDIRNLIVYSKLKVIDKNLSLSEKVCREYFEKLSVFGDYWENVTVEFIGDDTYKLSSFNGNSVKRSVTYLLNYYEIDLTPAKANSILIDSGFLEQLETTDKKHLKKFKSLTSKGLAYGVNVQHPDYHGVTQPYYSVDKFSDIADLLRRNL